MTRITASPKNTYALLVGIEDYGKDTPSLSGPALDAIRFASHLIERGVPSMNLRLILAPTTDNLIRVNDFENQFKDALVIKDASLGTLRNNIVAEIPSRSELFILLWGGHGTFEGGKRILHCQDTPLRISFDSLAEFLRWNPFWHDFPPQLCLIDSCASLVESSRTEEKPFEFNFNNLSGLTKPRSQAVLYATQPGEAALNQNGTGVFSSCILGALKEDRTGLWPPDLSTIKQNLHREQRGQRQISLYRDWAGDQQEHSNPSPSPSKDHETQMAIRKFLQDKYLPKHYKASLMRRLSSLDPYHKLFSHLIGNNSELKSADNMFTFLAKEIAESDSAYPLKLVGRHGTGKSSFLALLYLTLDWYRSNYNTLTENLFPLLEGAPEIRTV